MNTMTYKGYGARIEFDAEDMLLFGVLAGVNDRVSFHADNAAELVIAFQDAVDDYIETCAKIGKAPDKPYSGQLMVRVDPAVHAKAALAAELSGQSLARWTEDRLSRAADADVGAAVSV